MADLLDLTIAGGPPRVDFSPLSKLLGDYTGGVQDRAKVDSLQAFKGGTPTMPDGTPDYSAMAAKLYTTGDFGNANALSSAAVARAPLQFLPGALKFMAGGNSGQPAATPNSPNPATPSAVPAYFGKLAQTESSNNPNAANPNSTSSGLFGFTVPTWQSVMQAHPELGLTPQGMTDPLQALKAAQAFTADNGKALTAAGAPVNDQNLYLAHFLGPQGATSFLQGSQSNPNAYAYQLASPAAVKANQGAFFDKNGTPYTAQQFYTKLTAPFADSSGTAPAGQGAPASVGASSVSANNPALVGLVPPGTDPNQYLAGLRQYAAVLSASPQTKALGEQFANRAAAIEKALEPTAEQKNYYADRRPGESMADYQARVGQQTEAAKVPAEMYKDAAKDYKSAQATMYRLGLIDKSIDALGPDWMGTGANQRGAAARAWNTLTAFLPGDVAKSVQIDPRKVASWEDFTKQTQSLGFELARSLGSREAQMIVQQATNSVPNASQSPMGAKLVSASLRQAAQRQQDYYQFLTQRAKTGTLMGADVDFNNSHPVQQYVDAAVKSVAPQGVAPQAGAAQPGGQQAQGQAVRITNPQDYAGLKPGTQYIAPDGSMRVKGGQ